MVTNSTRSPLCCSPLWSSMVRANLRYKTICPSCIGSSIFVPSLLLCRLLFNSLPFLMASLFFSMKMQVQQWSLWDHWSSFPVIILVIYPEHSPYAFNSICMTSSGYPNPASTYCSIRTSSVAWTSFEFVSRLSSLTFSFFAMPIDITISPFHLVCSSMGL